MVVKEIIDAYVDARQKSFRDFMGYCDELLEIENKDNNEAINFLKSLLRPNIDARVFEITSYAILKTFYAEQSIFWGYALEKLTEDKLNLYKTGRTNANDGGIDFVMKPLGRFFQVTETIDVNKYFLDIDKVQRYPITFVVKSNETPEKIKEKIKQQATTKYKIKVNCQALFRILLRKLSIFLYCMNILLLLLLTIKLLRLLMKLPFKVNWNLI